MKKLVMEALVLVMVFVSHPVLAGSLDSPAAPTDAGSAMYTLEDVYNRIDDGTEGTKRPGAFTEPVAGPASTGKTLDDLYNLASERSRPGKTGQTDSYAAGDDGALQKGVAWPTPYRFTDNMDDGTVTDNLTGLIWLKNANCFGTRNWTTALSDCNTLVGNNTQCGLNDGSTAGDWRLPNIKELFSLIDFAWSNPGLSNAAGTAKWASGDAFTGVLSNVYWSSTTYALLPSRAWFVHMLNGYVYFDVKGDSYYVWPVRSGS